MKTRMLAIDVEKCQNCRNCYLACKDEHVDNDWPGYAAPQPGDGPAWIAICGKERGQFPLIDVAYLPLPCQHCRNAPCIAAAREGAVFRRPDGIVIIDPVKAKNQQHLVDACPYGAIYWNEALALPQKCTLCAHLLDEGWEKTRCIQACPTGALTLHEGDEDELGKNAAADGLAAYQPGFSTAPAVRYRNLFRFTHAFLGGSVATRRQDGREECAPGIPIFLYDQEGKLLAEGATDAFGDFKFDNLPADGTYTLQINSLSQTGEGISVDLRESPYIGVYYI